MVAFDSPKGIVSGSKGMCHGEIPPGCQLVRAGDLPDALSRAPWTRIGLITGGMTIKYENDPNQHAVTVMTVQLADQSALVGGLNWLHDIVCSILSVEYMEGSMRIVLDLTNDNDQSIEHAYFYACSVD